MKLDLAPHPDHPPAAVRGIEASIIGLDANWLTVRWKIDGSSQLHVPRFSGKGRADGLWQTTCFELFIRPEGGAGYTELNFSPSERWAAYDFTGYREGMAERPMPRQPDCTIRKGTAIAFFDVAVPLAGLPPLPWMLGISAVIEEKDGAKSYWALRHPDGKPDFHDPACFTLAVPAPGAS